MVLEELVDQIFLVNLDVHTERLELSKQEFLKIGSHFERFPACMINGGTHYSDRVNGCRKSHMEIIKLAKQRGYKRIAVFEDDIEFSPTFNERLPEIKDFLDRTEFNIFYLGGSHHLNQHEMVQSNVSRVRNTFTTHAYIVHESIYDFILQNEKLETPIDNILVSGVQSLGKSYCIRPNIGYQRAGLAYISGNITDYVWIKNT